jgi:hypothetical protein
MRIPQKNIAGFFIAPPLVKPLIMKKMSEENPGTPY